MADKKPTTPGQGASRPDPKKGDKKAPAKGEKKADKAADEAALEAPPEPTSGTGRFYYHNGATYEGEWISEPLPVDASSTAPADDDKKPKVKRLRHGKGVFKDGDYSYEGQWERDAMHGKGVFKFGSGAAYEGDWLQNKYQGKGKYQWKDGRCYDGEWQNGRMQGEGVFVDSEGHSWSGKFFNGSGPGLTCHL